MDGEISNETFIFSHCHSLRRDAGIPPVRKQSGTICIFHAICHVLGGPVDCAFFRHTGHYVQIGSTQ